MEKLELRDNDLYIIAEKKVDSIDPDREIAMIKAQIRELQEKAKVIKSYKLRNELTGQTPPVSGPAVGEK